METSERYDWDAASWSTLSSFFNSPNQLSWLAQCPHNRTRIWPDTFTTDGLVDGCSNGEVQHLLLRALDPPPASHHRSWRPCHHCWHPSLIIHICTGGLFHRFGASVLSDLEFWGVMFDHCCKTRCVLDFEAISHSVAFPEDIEPNLYLILHFRCSRQFHYIWMRSRGAVWAKEELAGQTLWKEESGGWNTWGGRGRGCSSSWRRASGGRGGRRRRRRRRETFLGQGRWRKLDLTPCSHDIQTWWNPRQWLLTKKKMEKKVYKQLFLYKNDCSK